MKKREKNLTITKEEIKNNHKIQTGSAYFYVYGILLFTILVIVISSMYRNNITPDYPVVFRDANNRLMVITKSSNGKRDITKINEAGVVYGNKDIKYILYTNDEALYLLDTTSNGSGIKLSDKVTDYGFSNDDKNIYYIESNGDLHIYNRKSTSNYLVDGNVLKFEDVVDDYVVYNKDNGLLIKNYNTGDLDIISKSYEDVTFGKDNKILLYSVSNGENKYNYYTYTINNALSNKVLTDVYELLNYNNTFTKFIYTTLSEEEINIYNNISDSLQNEDKKYSENIEDTLVNARNEMREYAKKYIVKGFNIYYQNKDSMTLLANNVNNVYLQDINDLKIVYSKDSWNKDFDLSKYNTLDEFKTALNENKVNSLYLQISDNEANLITDKISDNIDVNYIANDGLYYLENNTLYYSKVSGKKANTSIVVDSNILSEKIDKVSDLGLIYLTNEDDNNSLKYIKDGKYRVINENVYHEFISVSEKENSVYYVKDYNEHSGNLMIYNGIRNSKLTDGVSSFMYINDDLMYVTKNYKKETKTSDLYRLSDNKLTMIYSGVLEWYSPVKSVEE